MSIIVTPADAARTELDPISGGELISGDGQRGSDRPQHRAGAMNGPTVGEQFAHALVAKDFWRVRELLHPRIDFRALTPNRCWEASDADAVISAVLRQWFGPDDQTDALESVCSDSLADREHVAYRFTLHNPDGRFIVEQQAYLSVLDGRIGWMRVLCSGCRPWPTFEKR